MGNTEGDPYKEGGEVSKTDSPEEYQERTAKSSDFKNAVADALSKTPIAKLFVILSMLVYAIIAYSKRDIGVKADDISAFIFFSIFIVLVFIFLAVSSHIYRKYLKFFLIDGNDIDILNKCFNFFTKRSFFILILIALIFIFLIFKANLILFFNDAIRGFSHL